ncbi:MAG TPA: phosphatidylinositol mannoside acyltransferase [Acidimicrobiia bacterium]|nr:phosphatidylinositol mannoside acyltransferase [Acidimicrobiia bacterium]
MRNSLVYYGVRFLAGLVGLLPGSAARRLGEFGGLLWYSFGGERKRLSRRHMARVLGEAASPRSASPRAADPPALTRRAFVSYGRYWAETLWVRPRRIAEVDGALEVVGLEHLRQAAIEGRGAVIALPHLGNWEPAALAGKRAGIEIVAVAEKLANRRLTEWFTSLRRQFGITIVLAGRGSMRAIEAAVARGAAVCLLCDRDLSGRGVRVKFFGEETTLPVGPAALVIRTGAPLLIAACYFTPAGHRLVLVKPEVPADVRDVWEVTSLIAAGLEDLIRAAPEQWHLLQPNWPSDRSER